MNHPCKVSLHYSNKEPLLNQSKLITLLRPKQKGKLKPPKKQKKIKCVLVGDQAVGKTSLLVSYSNDSFPCEYIPTAYDNYNVEVYVDGKPIRLELCDTAGEDKLRDPLQSLVYPGSDVFMLCFSVVNPESFYSAYTHWAEVLSRYSGDIVLVGTKADLRNNREVLWQLRQQGSTPISQASAKDFADKLNAPYVETSAKTCMQLKEAFDLAITMALRKQKRSGWRKWCCLK